MALTPNERERLQCQAAYDQAVASFLEVLPRHLKEFRQNLIKEGFSIEMADRMTIMATRENWREWLRM